MCVCQIVLQQLEEVAGVNTVVQLYPNVFGLSASERPHRDFSNISVLHFNQKKSINVSLVC